MSNPDTQQFLVIDDHEAILAGTVPALQQRYPAAKITTAKDVQTAEQQIFSFPPDLVIVDISLPERPFATAKAEVGMQLIGRIMSSQKAPNIMVISTNIKPLVRLKPAINTYEGGFVAIDKSLPVQELLNSVELALRGSTYLPPELRTRPEFDRKWLRVIQLKYQEGLSDKAIAQAMGISDRTVRNYWVRIQDTLGVADDPNRDLRIQIQMAARKAGLLN